MKVILYSTHCPKCEVLKKKLVSNGIDFDEVNDIKIMVEMGFMTAPVLDVDGEFMNFSDANRWINTQ
ncbi:glutaredoxin family protein [Lacrimispora indolis]|uniref:glutaredoxin family protein n=1 Tax=Lacrimispora indolis TaxID=69825 RepID=UPI00046263C4|nr:hypothetical protein [[Clostridium] methoxybenzovorans]